MRAIIEMQGVNKIFLKDNVPVVALQDVNLTIFPGELIGIIGPSGSGKTTLLNLIGALDLPTEGKVLINGEDTSQMNPAQLDALRRRIGFVFQDFNLIERFTAVKNVELGMIVQGLRPKVRRTKAYQILGALGLADRVMHKPPELSTGQQQRVAIARALVQEPMFLLMDEPTGNVDRASRDAILAVVKELNTTRGITTTIVTHDPEIAQQMGRVIPLVGGTIQSGATSTGPIGESCKDLLNRE